ncbi:MAG: response regulator [Proteobacteria bacterium]|nr:response regulator [Pseudomonadota bacterium]
MQGVWAMSQGTTLSQLAAQRKLGFLGSLEKKLQSLRREAERFQRASMGPGAPGGRRSLDEIDRITRGLVGAGPIYNITAITAWAKKFLQRIEVIRRGKDAPTEEDFAWLTAEIQELERLRDKAVEEAQESLIKGDKPSASIKRSSIPPPVPESSRKSKKRTSIALPGVQSSEPPQPEFASMEAARTEPEKKSEERQSKPAPAVVTITVLVVVESKSVRKTVVLALRDAGFDVSEVSSLSSAERLIQEESPDLVVIDIDDSAPGGNDLVEILSRDPLTDFIPVLKLTGTKDLAIGNALLKPINTVKLTAEARRLTGQDIESSLVTKGLGDLNLEELTEFVSSEVRVGVLEAATGSHVRENFRVLEKGSLIASVWALIARLRRVVAEGSQGKIRFLPPTHGPIGMMALDEAERVLDPSSHEVVDDADIASLSGLSAIVVDDDVEIRTVFERVLTKAGMKVKTAVNGVEALSEIQQELPDVVITDILMPEMDGWELTTRLRWNYAFKHIPIIMISWKEDFLQRVRELNVAADDYMLKEVDLQQILSRVAGVLKPQFSLEQRLADEGVVTGRVERLGVITIIKSVMGLRPHCRITLRENWNYFEIDILGGEIAAVNRTGTDGSFASGMPALERLLGVSGGRFSVIQGIDKPKRHFDEGASVLMSKGTNRLNDLNNQVVDGALINIKEIELDEEVVAVYSKVIPPKLKTLLQRLTDGDIPRNIVLNASSSSEALETLILDLIHMGAVQNIISSTSSAEKTPSEIPEKAPEKIPEEKSDSKEIAAIPSVKPNFPSPEPAIESKFSGEHSHTMPISMEDVSEIINTPQGEPVPLLASQQDSVRPKQSRVWPAIAAVLLVGLVFMFILYTGKTGDEPDASSEHVSPVQEIASSAMVAQHATAVDSVTAVNPEEPAVNAPVEPSQEPEVKEPVEEPAAASPPVDKYGETPEQRAIRKARIKKIEQEKQAEEKQAPEPEKKKVLPEKKVRPVKKVLPEKKVRPKKKALPLKPQKKPVSKPAPRKEEKTAVAPPKSDATGLLSITAPPDAPGPIDVSVDGRARGKAPVKVKLTSGLHEVVFACNGKRTMRMVSIRIGQTKNMQAKIPR